MTDPLHDELEAIAAAIPAIPSDYATLRALIHSLPDPLLANLLGTRSGVPDASLGDIRAQLGSSGGAGSGGIPYPLLGELASSIDRAAVAAQFPFVGQANLFGDPAWEQFKRTSLALTTSYQSVCKNEENAVST